MIEVSHKIYDNQNMAVIFLILPVDYFQSGGTHQKDTKRWQFRQMAHGATLHSSRWFLEEILLECDATL